MKDRELILSHLPDSKSLPKAPDKSGGYAVTNYLAFPFPNSSGVSQTTSGPEGPRGGTEPPVTDLADASENDLWSLFVDRLTALGGREVHLDEVAEILDTTVFVDEDAEVLAVKQTNADIWEAEVGVTVCDWAIAETGSLILSAGPHRSRRGSLAPPRHLCFVRNDCVLATLAEGIEKLTPRTSVMITGPSRTADIEGVLVRGVHGPRELMVVRV